MRASLTVLAAVLLAFAALVLSACGLKGDLYLPESDSTPPSAQSGGDSEDTAESDGQASD